MYTNIYIFIYINIYLIQHLSILIILYSLQMKLGQTHDLPFKPNNQANHTHVFKPSTPILYSIITITFF